MNIDYKNMANNWWCPKPFIFDILADCETRISIKKNKVQSISIDACYLGSSYKDVILLYIYINSRHRVSVLVFSAAWRAQFEVRGCMYYMFSNH